MSNERLSKAIVQKLVAAESASSLAETLLEISAREPKWIMACNAEKLIAMSGSAEVLSVYERADGWIADGVGATLAARWCGAEALRIAGVALGEQTLIAAGRMTRSVALVGAAEDVSADLAEWVASLGAVVVFRTNGYFRDEQEVIRALELHAPDVICLAMGSPKQELLAAKLRSVLSRGLILCLGGSFDIYTGRKRRAPAVFQRLGLEWLFRLVSEPRRFRRYLRLRLYPGVLLSLDRK